MLYSWTHHIDKKLIASTNICGEQSINEDPSASCNIIQNERGNSEISGVITDRKWQMHLQKSSEDTISIVSHDSSWNTVDHLQNNLDAIYIYINQGPSMDIIETEE